MLRLTIAVRWCVSEECEGLRATELLHVLKYVGQIPTVDLDDDLVLMDDKV